jgi:glucose-1-phosphatase
MRVKNIIFDFGNVLFDLDLPQIEKQFRRLYADRYETVLEQLKDKRVFDLYETGGLDTSEFTDALRLAVEPALSTEQVVAAWNAIFIDMPARRFDMLSRLRKQYSVFLLSNINDLHARWIDGYMLREHHLHDFQIRFFDGVYYSHLIRLRKPTREIYEYVLADAELIPEECAFFDDLEANVEAAKTLGIRAFLHPVGRDIEAHVAELEGRKWGIAGGGQAF